MNILSKEEYWGIILAEIEELYGQQPTEIIESLYTVFTMGWDMSVHFTAMNKQEAEAPSFVEIESLFQPSYNKETRH